MTKRARYDCGRDRDTRADRGRRPAGLTASLLLSRHGVASLLIDKRRNRVAAAAGPGRALAGGGDPAGLRRRTGSAGSGAADHPGAEWAGGYQQPAAARGRALRRPDHGQPLRRVVVSQDVFRVGAATNTPAATPRRSCGRARCWSRCGPTTAAVQATVVEHASGRRVEVRARWMIAADGARSVVRSSWASPCTAGRPRPAADDRVPGRPERNRPVPARGGSTSSPPPVPC